MIIALFILAIIALASLFFLTWSFSRKENAYVSLMMLIICGLVLGAQSVLNIVQWAGS